MKIRIKKLIFITSKVLAISLLLSGVVALAANFLSASKHVIVDVEAESYLDVDIDGLTCGAAIRPGRSISMSPSITNNGSVEASAFIKVTLPAVDGSAAYSFESNNGWNKVEEVVNSNVSTQIWSYGGNANLESLSPGAYTNPLTDSFTMRSDITGAQFANMSDMSIAFEGYLMEYTAGTDPEEVWHMIPGNE